MKKAVLLVLLLVQSVFALDIFSIEKELKSIVSSKGRDTSTKFAQLREVSKKLNLYTPSFHGNIIADLKRTLKPLHGEQLTIMHRIVSVYIGLDYQLQKITSHSSRPHH